MSQNVFYSIKQVKEKCMEGRFFSYTDWFDKIFVPPSIYLVWVSVNLRISANVISWVSAFFAIFAAILFSSQNSIFIFLGSLFYLLYYLLDYVDGSVARFNQTQGVSGQYMDWIMHVISSTAIMSGLAIGAINASGFWLVPFSIIAIIASVLTYARHSMAWFAIIMENQQKRSKGIIKDISFKMTKKRKESIVYDFIRKCVCKFYHEETLLFLLPLLALLHLYITHAYLDFRVLLIIGAGAFYFPVMLIEIHRLASNNKIPEAYNKLFISSEKPILPDDHFLK